MNVTDWQWLESTYRLQHESFGVTLPLPPNTNWFADYVVMNHTALSVELGELMNEVGWKSWSEPRGWVNREAVLSEAVDVAHFLANILCAVGITDEEWVAAYQSKQATNRRRQLTGYDSREGKCPGCRRAYDDEATRCFPGEQVAERDASGHVTVYYDLNPWCQEVGDLDSSGLTADTDPRSTDDHDVPDELDEPRDAPADSGTSATEG